MFVGVFQIIGRTVFNTVIYGYIDYMEQASTLFAFLGISYAQRVGAISAWTWPAFCRTVDCNITATRAGVRAVATIKTRR
jgi:hypothetical protein